MGAEVERSSRTGGGQGLRHSQVPIFCEPEVVDPSRFVDTTHLSWVPALWVPWRAGGGSQTLCSTDLRWGHTLHLNCQHEDPTQV